MKYNKVLIILICFVALQLFIINNGWRMTRADLKHEKQLFCGKVISVNPNPYIIHHESVEDEQGYRPEMNVLFDDKNLGLLTIDITENTCKTSSSGQRICFNLSTAKYVYGRISNLKTACGIVLSLECMLIMGVVMTIIIFIVGFALGELLGIFIFKH